MAGRDWRTVRTIEEATIRMPYLRDDELGHLGRVGDAFLVAPESPIALRRAAGQVARQYQREVRCDQVPYLAERPGGDLVVLLPSPTFLVGYGVCMAGALGVNPAARLDPLPGPVPAVRWIYLHPYERGRNLVVNLWPWLARRWQGICMGGPFTAAGLALLRQLVEHGMHPATVGPVPAEQVIVEPR